MQVEVRGPERQSVWNPTGRDRERPAFAPRRLPRQSVGFAAKVIGVGVFAGLMLTYCNALIDACFRGIL